MRAIVCVLVTDPGGPLAVHRIIPSAEALRLDAQDSKTLMATMYAIMNGRGVIPDIREIQAQIAEEQGAPPSAS